MKSKTVGDRTRSSMVPANRNGMIQALERRILLSTVAFTDLGLASGGSAAGSVAGDFNQDGKADIATISSSALFMYLGKGDGTFQPAIEDDIGANPTSRVADLNGDSHLDIYGGGGIFYGTGDGRFQQAVLIPRNHPDDTAINDMVAVDVNSDGRLDLLTANGGSATVRVFLQNSDGTFSETNSVAVGAEPYHLSVADVDGDGKMDAVLGSVGQTSLTLLLGNGDGTFRKSTLPAPESNVHLDVALGDLNGDGRPDLAYTNGSSGPSVKLNLGGGSFSPSTQYAVPDDDDASIDIGNFTNDGRPDLLSAPYGGSYSGSVFTGRGDGTFDLATNLAGFGPQQAPVALADFNGDGLTDISAKTEVMLSAAVVMSSPHFSTYHLADETVATFTDNQDPGNAGATTTATIDWGDSRTSMGTVIADGSSNFHVVASHDYPYKQNYTFTVTLRFGDGRSFSVEGIDEVFSAPELATIHEFSPGGNNFPDKVVQGPNGDVWFGYNPDYQSYPNNPRVSSIGRINTTTDAITLYPIPGTGAGPRILASDGAGNAWFGIDSTHIGRLDGSTGAVTQYLIPVALNNALTRGPGGDLWFPVASTSSGKVDRLARISTIGSNTGNVTIIPLTTATIAISNMVLGPDGNFWGAQYNPAAIARITPAGVVTIFPIVTASNFYPPDHVTVGPDGNIWFTSQTGRSIGRITLSGFVTLFAVHSDPVDITTGADGALWYVGFNSNTIGRIDTSGTWNEFSIDSHVAANGTPNGSTYPESIVPGGDGNLWFSESTLGKVARFNLTEAAYLTAAPPSTTRKNVPFSGQIARLTDATEGAPSDYAVSIDWGDDTYKTTGTVVATPSGYSVQGSHTYTEESVYHVLVTVTPYGDIPVTIAMDIAVDYPLNPVRTYTLFGAEGRPIDGTPLFTFQDTDPDGVYGPFNISIAWGDGTTSTGVAVAGSVAGTLDVSANHTYSNEGQYPVTVTVKDVATSISTTTAARIVKAIVAQPPAAFDAASGAVAIGDFNGDGIPDVVSADPAGNLLDVLSGLGGGNLAPARVVATVNGIGVRSLAVADFNRDGRADVAALVWDGTAAHVETYFGMADGTFTLAGSFAARSGVMVVADFNGDGKPDIATAGIDAASLVIALGNGAGAFVTSTVPLAAPSPTLVVADFNRDGHPDLAAGGVNNTSVHVLFGSGTGAFAVAVDYAGGVTTATAYLAAGDFTGDGAADLAVADAKTNALYVLVNSGGGAFAARTQYKLDDAVASGAAGAISGLSAVDVNADGEADLIRGASDSVANIDVRLAEGSGTYKQFQSDSRLGLGPFSLPVLPLAVATADLNGDGRVDFVASGGGKVVVAMNTPYTLTPLTITLNEGASFLGILASFVNENLPTQAAGLTATVDWGDGSSSTAFFVANSLGTLSVDGGHTYRRAGTYATLISVRDAHGLITTATGTMKVSNAAIALSGQAISATINAPVTAIAANFTDANPLSQITDFTASIDWGNGRVTAGIVRGNPSGAVGAYTVTGTQTYAASGSFTVKVTVTDAAAPTSPYTASSIATVKPLVNGGGSISGAFYNDLNFNAVRDGVEPPLFAWTAFVDANNNGVLDSGEPFALSSSTGQFTIADVAAGTWTVREVPDPAWRETFPTGDGSQSATLTPGQAVTGLTFLDTRRPTALIDAGPALRNTPLDAAAVTFSEKVQGLDLSDLTLTRDGVAVALTGGGASATLSTTDNVHYTLGGLSPLTAASGSYALTLEGAGSDIKDADAHELAIGVTSGFTVNAPPTIVSWASAATHAKVGEVALTIPDDNSFVEDRLSGIRTLLVTFSSAINAASLTPAGVGVYGLNHAGQAVNLSGISITTTTRNGDTVAVLSFSKALPDYARYLVRLSRISGPGGALTGDNDRVLTALLGDATGDGRVNNTDVGAIQSLRGIDPISASVVNQVRSDVTLDGRVNNTDVGGVTTLRGEDTRSIPVPTAPLALVGGAKTAKKVALARRVAAAPRKAVASPAVSKTAASLLSSQIKDSH